MTRFLALLVLLALSACGAPQPKGDPIPLKRLFAETPRYECANYEASSDSCEGIALRRVLGDRVSYDAEFLMPQLPNIPGRARVQMKASFKMEATRYCGNFRNADVKVSGVPSSYAIDLAIIFKAQMAKQGDMCTRYYRQQNGTYLSVTTRPDGSRLRDGTAPVQFLPAPKKLRSIGRF
jgi:hypothetical protein